MDTWTRSRIYEKTRMTARKRRRLVKKAGRDPYAIVVREDGMGYPPSMQGVRELVGCEPTPVDPPGHGLKLT